MKHQLRHPFRWIWQEFIYGPAVMAHNIGHNYCDKKKNEAIADAFRAGIRVGRQLEKQDRKQAT